MRNRRTNIVLFLAGTSWLAIACTSGSGPLAVFSDPYDPAPDSRDKPPSSRDNPTVSTDVPPGTIDNPGSLGGGPSSSGGANGCPPCNGTWKCATVVGNQTETSTLVLVQNGTQCVGLDDTGKAAGTLSCTGAVTDANGNNQGTWQSTGGDGFSVSTTVTSGKTTTNITTTCAKQSDSTTPPMPTATAPPAGTATPTPVPTGTGGTGIVDAGTSG